MPFSQKTKIILGIGLLIAVLGRFGVLGPVQNFLVWATKPFLVAGQSVTFKIANSFNSLTNIGVLQKENNDLKHRITLLESENAQLKSSVSEISFYEEALNLKQRTGWSLTGARVVSADPTSFNQTLVIDRGESAGLVEGQAVVDAAGAYVGRLTRVLRNTSEVTLMSDTTNRMPSEVADSGARGIIAGQHGLSIALIEVPQGQQLPQGGRIITTGFTPGVPSGLLVGFVDSLRSKPSDLFQEANVRPAADLRKLRIIFVITGS